MPYLSVDAIQSAIDHIVATYPAIASTTVLPEQSVEGRPVKLLKIASGGGANRKGVLFLGGTHAREFVNPDALVSFALRLSDAYATGSGMNFGPKVYPASTVKLLVEALDIFFVPLVNPDGRAFCMAPGGNTMWRKNRSHHPGNSCRGVDLNRNTDFLWSSGIGTSSDSCSDVYKGPNAFSEPESRNVRWVLDNRPNIAAMLDVHSYSELVLYPWGDDNNQTTDPSMNFLNPAFDGQRDQPTTAYMEYIPAADLDDFQDMGGRMRDGIAAVRGHVYTLEQSRDLYATTGTFHDYGYSRHFVNTGLRRVLSFTIESGLEFQPGEAERANIILELGPCLIECMLESVCPVDFISDLLAAIFPPHTMSAMRAMRDETMRGSDSGKRYIAMLKCHKLELIKLAVQHKDVRGAAQAIAPIASRLAGKASEKISTEDTEAVEAAMKVLAGRAGKALRSDIDTAGKDLRESTGLSIHAALTRLDQARD